MWIQREIPLGARPRGVHLVGREIVAALPELSGVSVGLLHLHILHTSAGLALNENASFDVRADLETWLDRAVPGGPATGGTRSRGPTTCPRTSSRCSPGLAHAADHRRRARARHLAGIYLCEFRDRGGPRRLIATLNGDD